MYSTFPAYSVKPNHHRLDVLYYSCHSRWIKKSLTYLFTNRAKCPGGELTKNLTKERNVHKILADLWSIHEMIVSCRSLQLPRGILTRSVHPVEIKSKPLFRSPVQSSLLSRYNSIIVHSIQATISGVAVNFHFRECWTWRARRDRVFTVAGPRAWKSLPKFVTISGKFWHL